MFRALATPVGALPILALVLLLALACSNSERSEPGSGSPQQSADAAQRDLFAWPDGAGEPRDIDADLATCNKQLEGVQNWMAGVQKLIACMTAEGWVLKKGKP